MFRNLLYYKYKQFITGNTYNETLQTVKESFPQYLLELEGIADGAEVEFHKVICVEFVLVNQVWIKLYYFTAVSITNGRYYCTRI